MPRLSMSEIWDETRTFLAREKALVLPLGFATFGVALLLLGLTAPQGGAGATRMPAGPWMLWLVPGFLLMTIGYLAISAIVLLPNISVREALGIAMARLPSAILLTGLLVGAMLLLLTIAAMIMGVLGAGLGWAMGQAVVASLAIALIPMFWLSIRLVVLWPLLVDRGPRPLDAIGRSFALTAGYAARIGALILLAAMVYMLGTGVAQIAGGSVFLLIGRVLGSPGLGHTLTAILVAAVGGLLATVWSLFVALLYRRLASSNGT